IARSFEELRSTVGPKGLLEAVRRALRQVRGAYGLAVVSEDAPERIVVAKNASPLVIGIGRGESLCASDIPALLSYTRDILLLEDGELAELTATSVRIETVDGALIERPSRRIDWSPVQAE